MCTDAVKAEKIKLIGNDYDVTARLIRTVYAEVQLNLAL